MPVAVEAESGRPIDKEFLSGSTVEVAKRLIGCQIRYNTEEGAITGIINETEAYTEDDPACHAFGGRMTPRNRTMFAERGHLYVYLIYGMYHCANIVTEGAGSGCAVLLRGVIPVEGVDLMLRNRGASHGGLKHLSNGPGKLCTAFGWDKSHDGINLLGATSPITLYKPSLPVGEIAATPRIGISKAKERLWRFTWSGA